VFGTGLAILQPNSKKMKTLIILIVASLSLNLNSFAVNNENDTVKFTSLNAGIYSRDNGLQVNLVNTDNQEVKLVVKDLTGKIVYTKKMSQKSFSSKLYKTAKLKTGTYVVELVSASKVIRKTVKV